MTCSNRSAPPARPSLSSPLVIDATNALGGFAEAVAPFAQIGDFDPTNIGFDATSKTWRIFDFAQVELYEGATYPVEYQRKPFENTKALEWRALQRLIGLMENRRAPE